MKFIRLLVATGLALMWAWPACAGTAGPVRLKNVHFMSNGVVIAQVEGPRSNPPQCAIETGRFALNGTTAGGKVQAAGLLAAYTAGKQVTIYGTSSCTAWGDTETVDFFLTVD